MRFDRGLIVLSLLIVVALTSACGVEDSVEILMGIKEKLEIHHGIKISKDAIYNSVMLSDQYITDKYLPDKAIDLVDESSSALKLSAEAMPSKLVELESDIRAKKVLVQVEKNKDELEKEIKILEKKFQKDKMMWEKEVLAIKQVTELKNQQDHLRFELEQAERKQDYERANLYFQEAERKLHAATTSFYSYEPLRRTILFNQFEVLLKVRNYKTGRCGAGS